MTILFVTYGLPYPPDTGVNQRYLALIRQVSKRHRVLLLSILLGSAQKEYVAELKAYCDICDFVEPRILPWKEHLTRALKGLPLRRSPATAAFMYDELFGKIRQLITDHNVDIIQIEHSVLAPYVDAVPAGSECVKVLSFHNHVADQYKSMLSLKSPLKERLVNFVKWLSIAGWEAKYAERFDCSITVSHLEAKRLLDSNPALQVSVIENGVDAARYEFSGQSQPSDTILFVGTMGYPPNFDAALYFCTEIFPKILNRRPDAKFVVVGQGPYDVLQKLRDFPNVEVTGWVQDVVPFYRQAGVVVVPLRSGGGTRLKILEAMALGVPVVSTSFGCEGLELANRQHLLVEDASVKFADSVLRLLQDNRLAEKIRRQARQCVEERYDWNIIGRKLLAMYDTLKPAATPQPEVAPPAADGLS